MSSTHDQFLVDVQQLQAELDSPELRIFDTAVTLQAKDGRLAAISGRGDYEQAHIPGAGFLDLIDALADGDSGLGFTLPALDVLAQSVGELGIAADSPVVLYSSGHLMWATRAFWLLYALGHKRLRILNGGLAAWQSNGFTTESGTASYPACEYQEKPRSDAFVDLVGMKALVASGERATVCTLSADVYAGRGDFHYGRRGHIPGSEHLHYEDLLDSGAFPAPAELHKRLNAAGFGGEESAVSYCGGGIAATVLAFARLLSGCGPTTVYDGSMSEWVRDGQPLREGEQP